MLDDAIAKYGVVAIIGAIVGILFHAAIVTANSQGGVIGIVVSAALGGILFVGIDIFTEDDVDER
jgi:zinc transporter ZupT